MTHGKIARNLTIIAKPWRNGVIKVGTGDPIGQSGIFDNDLGTALDPNQPIYRLSKKMT